MLNKNKYYSIAFLILMFFLSILFFIPNNKYYKITSVISPVEFILDRSKTYIIKGYDTFDSEYTEKNKRLARKLNISEDEAFLLGNIAKNEVKNYMQGRKVFINKNYDLINSRKSYRTKYFYSGYCIKNLEPCVEEKFHNKLNSLRKTKYKVLDLESSKVYDINDSEIHNLENFLVIPQKHIPKNFDKQKRYLPKKEGKFGDIKIFLSDFNLKYHPDKNCNSGICKEILNNINESQKSIDIAIYGYSTIPKIEEALIKAEKRGVKIRLVYDVDSQGENIYPNTDKLIAFIKNNNSDKLFPESGYIMHNKFYIFDEKILITGSANLSETDMSEFNSNSVLVIHSPKIADIYKQEFEQMYNGNFHSSKNIITKEKISISDSKLNIYFSPKDKSIENGILPIIKTAKNYIYIPVFFLTDKRIVEELIQAKKRSVDVKIIIDAVSASTTYSKHNELRKNGVLVKVENLAGKMHSKSIIIDDVYTVVGSMNFTNSGENKNDENLIVIEDKQIAKLYKDFFLYQWGLIDEKYLKKDVRAEGFDSIGSCYDGIDNNYDGLIDSEDRACKQ